MVPLSTDQHYLVNSLEMQNLMPFPISTGSETLRWETTSCVKQALQVIQMYSEVGGPLLSLDDSQGSSSSKVCASMFSCSWAPYKSL